MNYNWWPQENMARLFVCGYVWLFVSQFICENVFILCCLVKGFFYQNCTSYSILFICIKQVGVLIYIVKVAYKIHSYTHLTKLLLLLKGYLIHQGVVAIWLLDSLLNTLHAVIIELIAIHNPTWYEYFELGTCVLYSLPLFFPLFIVMLLQRIVIVGFLTSSI